MTDDDRQILNAVAAFLPTAPPTFDRLLKKCDADPVEVRRSLNRLIAFGYVKAQTLPATSPAFRITTYLVTADGRAALMAGAA